MIDDHNQDDDRALAYMRNELTLEARMRYLAHAADDTALREELVTLRAAAQIAAEQQADATADASFARLAATLNLRTQSPSSETLAEAPQRDAARPRQPAREPWHERVRVWWRAHANVLQPALIALVIAQSGVIAHFTVATRTAEKGEDTVVTRGAAVSCMDAWVTFKDGVSEQQLREWLTLYGASIAAGPDDAGRYRIETRDADARAALLQSGEAQRLAARIEPPFGCAGK